jgi:rod shape determining protein RodA
VSGIYGLAREVPSRGRHLLQWLHLDLPLVVGLGLLSLIGLGMLYSAGNQDLDLVLRQGVRLGVAFTALLVFAQLNPAHLQRWAPHLYVAGLVLLVAVLVMGEVGKGAQRWLDVGLFRFQPSEVMKLAVPLGLSWYFAERPLPPDLRAIGASLAMIVLPVLLVARQPDLGTALLIGSSGGFALFLAGLSWRLIALGAILAALAAPLVWLLMRDYQRQRVLTFLNPENDPLGAGYHIIQSTIAIGSGGIYGKGWLEGTQSHLDFLPERSTDFIFAAFAEEFGFTGVLILLALYLLVIARGLYIASQAQSTFARLVAGSLTLTFFVYVFVNIGMVTGLLPVVGLPLPLISYGGTSLVTVMSAFGILMSIHTHRKLLPQ